VLLVRYLIQKGSLTILFLLLFLLLVHAVYLGEALDSRPWHDTGGASSGYTPLSLSPRKEKEKSKLTNGVLLIAVSPSGCAVRVAGAYDDEEAAARAYDLAALKYWGPDTILNFPVPPKFIGRTRRHNCSHSSISLPAIS
jgi:hypothetical protein